MSDAVAPVDNHAHADDGERSPYPHEMEKWPHDKLPDALVVFELAAGSNLDVRYQRRTHRIRITSEADLNEALTVAHAGSGHAYEAIQAERMNTALSVSVTGRLIYAVLLKPHVVGEPRLRFSHKLPPFMAGNERALKHQFQACNVSFNGGPAKIGDLNDPAIEAGDGRMALFYIDMDGASQTIEHFPFNINVEVRGTLPGGARYITPIIIDPDIPHPPEGGGIPTHP